MFGYEAVASGDNIEFFRVRRRGTANEVVVLDFWGDHSQQDRMTAKVLRQAEASHALRLGQPNVLRGFLPYLGGGPALAFRSLRQKAPPTLSNWRLTMGDIELF